MDLEINDIVIDLKTQNEFHDSKEILINYDKLKKTNRSKPIMSKYERTKIIGVRAQQISQGSVPLVEVPKHLSSTLDIATYELKLRKTPFIVKRNVGRNIEYWKVEDLIINGKIIGCIEEERLNREKRTRKFPILSINHILKENNLSLKDIDANAVSWNPQINLEKYQKNFNDSIRHLPEILYSIPANLLKLSSKPNSDLTKYSFKEGQKNIDLY